MMKIGIVSKYPHVFALALAHTLKQGGSVNVKTNVYDGLLFESGANQEQGGIVFNTDEPCDYEISINGEDSCDILICHSRSVYRDFSEQNTSIPVKGADVILVVEHLLPGVRFGRRFITSACRLPAAADCFEYILEEKDLLADCHFGMKPDFSLDKLSKSYRTMLLDLYNRLHGTSYTRIKQIRKGAS